MSSLNPGGRGVPSWNFSDPSKPNYSTELIGTVVAMQQVQAMEFRGGKPYAPKVWPDGNPVWNIRITLAGPKGGLISWMFPPASGKALRGERKSVHMDLFALTGNTDMRNLIDKTIRITTQEGNYGLGNPRPWTVEELDNETLTPPGPWKPLQEVPADYVNPKQLANAMASGGQMNQQPAQPAQYPAAPAPQYAPQPQYQQPMPQYAPQPQYGQQVPPQHAPQQSPMQAPMQPMIPPMPPQQQAPMAPQPQMPPTPYDEDMPF